MPFDFVKMHRASGFESNLVTLYRNSINFEEDICLDLKLPEGKLSKKWRDSKISPPVYGSIKYIEPKNILEKLYFYFRDVKNRKIIYKCIKDFDLWNYDIYHFDGGMDLFRDLRFVKELKKRNKKIVCCYFGSDLRTRGIFRELDGISDLNLTVEYDHLRIHKNINYIYFPFDTDSVKAKKSNNSKIKIVHSPTNRKFKGTDKIISVINELKSERDFEFILLEKEDRENVLEIKRGCDIAIDQVGGEMGGTGYGKNSIESLSMGIPTVTEFNEEYLSFIKNNPFIHSTIENLKSNLLNLIDNEKLRNDLSAKGIEWVKEFHSFSSVSKSLKDYYKKHNII